LKVELDKKIIDEIVEVLAEELEIKHLGLEEEEVLIRLASLSIAIYLGSLRRDPDQSTKIH
jgi:hypothetical protein